MSTVLIAEDEALLRLDLVESFQRAGFDTLEACSADEAMVLLEHHEHVCCLFTDIQMPGNLDGLQLAELVSERWPGKIIVIGSGNLRPVKVPAGAVFVPKPYDPEKLTVIIGDMERRIERYVLANGCLTARGMKE